MAMTHVMYKEEPNALKKISILAKNPANGGIPAKLKRVNIVAKPNNGFIEESCARSENVLLLFSLIAVVRDKKILHKHKLVII